MVSLRILPCGSECVVLTALLVLALVRMSDARPASEGRETNWVKRDKEWYAESEDDDALSILPLHRPSSAASQGAISVFKPSCGRCNESECAQKTPEKCKGILQWDACGCCKVCVKREGQRCQSKRRPCQSGADLHCLPSEDGIKRCQTVEGNCTKASHGEGLFHRNFPNCQKCHCSKGEQQLCRPVKCAPSSATLPENCIKQRCIEFPWPEQCCPTYGFCECTKWQVPLSVNPQCSEPPSCPSNRTSGKNISSVRYYYDQQEERCVMFWQTPKCSDDRSYSSLSACRTQCVPTDHPGTGSQSSPATSNPDSCGAKTAATKEACANIHLKHHTALFRGLVQHMEQIPKGVLYTVDVKHSYRGSCRKGNRVYILALRQTIATVCPFMEVNYPFLIGYKMSTSNVQCQGSVAVKTLAGETVQAEVLYDLEPSTTVIPWNQATRTFAEACMSTQWESLGQQQQRA